MQPDDIRAFVNRDWDRVADAKTRTWLAAKGTPADDLRMADDLRRHARRLRPDFPSARDRADDLQSHLRVIGALDAVGVRHR